MLTGSARLQAAAPTLCERRGERTLLVWGELGQWMVVDDEVVALLGRLDGEQRLDEALLGLGADGSALDLDGTAPVVSELMSRRILREPGRSEPEDATDTEPLLGNLTLNVTRRCNLHCAHCYVAGPRGPELPVETLLAGLAGIGAVCRPGASLILLGGEPLLDVGRLRSILAWARRDFERTVTLSTNGTPVTPELAALLADRAVEVQVSIDSPEPAENDALRGPGAFAAATRAVRLLARAGVRVLVSMVYTARTFRRLEALLEACRELGAEEARFMPLRGLGRARCLLEQVPDQAVVLEHVLDVLGRRPELRDLLGRGYFASLIRGCSRSSTRTSCGIGTETILVDADGAVYPCPNHCAPAFCLGSVAEQPLARIYRNSPELARLRAEYRVERYDDCRSCGFRRWCAGDCRGEVLARGGSASGRAPHCAELQRVYRRLCWLLADGDPRVLALGRSRDGSRAASDGRITGRGEPS